MSRRCAVARLLLLLLLFFALQRLAKRFLPIDKQPGGQSFIQARGSEGELKKNQLVVVARLDLPIVALIDYPPVLQQQDVVAGGQVLQLVRDYVRVCVCVCGLGFDIYWQNATVR